MSTMALHSPIPRRLRSAIRTASAHIAPGQPALFALTDPVRTSDCVDFVQALPAQTGVIYRHFGAADRIDVATTLRQITYARHQTLLIAADPMLAILVSADGVHWPEKSSRDAFKYRDRFRLQTVSAHSTPALRSHWQTDVFDGILWSTVFPSNSASAGPPMGAIRFRRQAMNSPIPVYALGGINQKNAAHIAETGGFAAIDGVRKPRI